MCHEMDTIYREWEMHGEERGRIEGRMEKAKEMAVFLEQIAQAAKVSVNLV